MIQPDNAGKPGKGIGTKPLALAIILLLLVNLSIVQVSAAKPKASELLSPLADEAVKYVWKGSIIAMATNMKNFFYSLYDNMLLLILANPPIAAVKGFMGFFINLVQPFYILAIVLLGFQLIFVASSPKERAEIKTLFGWFLASLMLVSLSPYLLVMLMGISNMLTTLILGIADPNLGIQAVKGGTDVLFDTFKVLNWVHMTGGVEIGILHFGFMKLLYFIMILRYMMVGFWGILFPVTVFFYSVKPFRDMGKNMFAQTIMWIFMQVAWAIGLIAIAVSFASIQQVYPQFPLMYIYLASFFLFFASPMIILGIMDWLSLGLYIFGTVSATPMSQGAGYVDSASSFSGSLIDEEEVVIKPIS